MAPAKIWGFFYMMFLTISWVWWAFRMICHCFWRAVYRIDWVLNLAKCWNISQKKDDSHSTQLSICVYNPRFFFETGLVIISLNFANLFVKNDSLGSKGSYRLFLAKCSKSAEIFYFIDAIYCTPGTVTNHLKMEFSVRQSHKIWFELCSFKILSCSRDCKKYR